MTMEEEDKEFFKAMDKSANLDPVNVFTKEMFLETCKRIESSWGYATATTDIVTPIDITWDHIEEIPNIKVEPLGHKKIDYEFYTKVPVKIDNDSDVLDEVKDW